MKKPIDKDRAMGSLGSNTERSAKENAKMVVKNEAIQLLTSKVIKKSSSDNLDRSFDFSKGNDHKLDKIQLKKRRSTAGQAELSVSLKLLHEDQIAIPGAKPGATPEAPPVVKSKKTFAGAMKTIFNKPFWASRSEDSSSSNEFAEV